ncbi:hypothetical protein QS923_25960, partial [Escherichia coli]|nr:hypothetical protein [Escherichia coli]
LGSILFIFFYSFFILTVLSSCFKRKKNAKGIQKIRLGIQKIRFFSQRVYKKLGYPQPAADRYTDKKIVYLYLWLLYLNLYTFA